MSTVKDAVKSVYEALPDTATFDDAHYELYVKEKLINALEQADNGETYTEEEVKNIIFSKQ